MDRLGKFLIGVPGFCIQWMSSCTQSDVGANHHIIPNDDQTTVKDCAIGIHKKIFTNPDVVTVITKERPRYIGGLISQPKKLTDQRVPLPIIKTVPYLMAQAPCRFTILR